MYQNNLWCEFRHPLVRQLAFCIGSPNILTQLPSTLNLLHHFDFHTNLDWQQHLKNYLPKLKYLDQHPHRLEIFLSQLKSTRLGLRFEMLLWFWLLDRDYHAYQLLGHRLQQIQGARTVGELDFLILNTQTQQIEHWEVALKYYLGEADLSLNHWYGLNRCDTLQRKLQHFTQQQFQFNQALGHHIEKRFCILKGKLFLASNPQTTTLLPWINPHCLFGQWGTVILAPSEQYYRLQRNEWIFPHVAPSSATPLWWTDGLYYSAKHEQFYMYRNTKHTVFTDAYRSV